jgi:hypothetical protein
VTTTRRRPAALPPEGWAPLPRRASDIGPLVVTVTGEDGRTARFDLSACPAPRLVRRLADAFADSAGIDGTVRSARTGGRVAAAIRAFTAHLAAARPGTDGLDAPDLTAGDIDSFAAARCQLRGMTRGMLRAVVDVIALLRRVEASAPGLLDPGLVHRLSWGADDWPDAGRPLDAYSPREAKQLERAALIHLRAVRTRLDAGRELAAAANPTGPWTQGRIVRHIADRGPVAHEMLGTPGLPTVHQIRQAGGLRRLHSLVYLDDVDVCAFLVAIGLSSGLEPEAVRELRAGCLRNADGGWAEVDSVKRRRHYHAHVPTRVRDGNLRTTGGQVRLAVTLTAAGRRHLGTPFLWVFWRKGGLREAFTGDLDPIDLTDGTVHSPAARFVARYGLTDDDGAPLLIDGRRLRKTEAKRRYERAGGRFNLLPRNQTPDVAAARYGNIRALDDAHDGAVADGIRDAVNAARHSATVLDPGAERAARADPAAASGILGVAPGRAQEILSGERDLWLAACADFHNSPFARPGDPCPVPFTACLGCGNAIIHSGKLPAILAFLDHMNRQRELLGEAEWQETFATTHDRIVTQILPRFPEGMVREARDIAAASGELIYLPPPWSTP